MIIRLFRLSDSLIVSSLIGRAVRIRNTLGYTEKQTEALANYYSPENFCLNLKRKIIYVCLEENKIVGTATLRDDELMAVFIEPNYQKLGLGVKLITLLENDAIKKGYSKVWLVSFLSAVEFYKKLGYVSISEKIHPDWGKGIFMEKLLKS